MSNNRLHVSGTSSSSLRNTRPDDGLIKEGPKHVVYYCSFTSNEVCCVFDYLPIFQLDIANFPGSYR
jgi:hypothetical protein